MAFFQCASSLCVSSYFAIFNLMFAVSGSPLLADHYRAFPEIGISLVLRARMPHSTSGWSEVSGWTHIQSSDTGHFLFGAPLVNKESRFELPKSGIYFASLSVHLSQADIGVFHAAFTLNGQIDKRNKAMTAVKQGHPGADFSLTVSGFMDLRSGDQISVFILSEEDKDWFIENDSQFSLRYSGSVGSFPAFSAIKDGVTPFSPFSFSQIIRNWETSGSQGLFASLTGFSTSTGEFVPICDGIYFVASNVRVQAGPGLYKLYLSVSGNVLDPFLVESVIGADAVFTMNLQGAFYFKKGDKISLNINSSNQSTELSIHPNSGFSLSYIDAFNQSSLQGVSTVTQIANEIPGTGWMEISTWAIPLNAHVQFYNPKVFQRGRFSCTQGGIYYVSVSLLVHGGRGNFELLVKSSGTSKLDGHAGLYTTSYKSETSTYISLSLSGLLELSKGQHVLVFVHSSFPESWFIEQGSGVSVMKTRHYWPAANSFLHRRYVTEGGAWNKIRDWKQTGEGAFSFSSNFRKKSSWFLTTSPGVYFVSTNLIMRTAGCQVSAAIAIDEQPGEDNGLYATHAYPPTLLTLNIAGSLNLENGQKISVYVRVENNGTLEVLERSGFSVIFIGKSFAIPSFHAIKGSQSTIGTTNWVEIDEWSKPGSEKKAAFENGEGFNSVRGVYVAPISGIYFISCVLVIKDLDVVNFSSYFEVYVGVNSHSQTSFTNGLQNTHYLQGKVPPMGNDVITVTVSGMVQLKRGDYTVIRARANMDSDWKVEGTSSLSMFLVSPSEISYGNVGFLSRKSDTRIKSVGLRRWSKIGGWATQSDLTNGLFLKNDGSFTYEALSGDLNINHAGIYFLSVNIIVSNTPESCEVAVRVSDSRGRDIQDLITGFTAAAERKLKSQGKYTLLITGAAFLKKGRRIHLAVRSGSVAPFTVWEGSGFSVARLIYPIEEPGFYARIRNFRTTGQSGWEEITGWETSGVSGLHSDGRGFSSLASNFKVPLSGIYLASASLVIKYAQMSEMVFLQITVNGKTSPDGGLVSSCFIKRGAHAVVAVSGSMKLLQGMTINVMMRSKNSSFQISEGSYFTMRFMSKGDKTKGNMADRYSDVSFISNGWKELVSWRTTGVNGQFQVGSIHQTTDRFWVSKSGIYFATGNIQLLETDGLVIIAIVVNNGNDTAVVSKKTCVTGEVCSLNLAVPLVLTKGTVVSVQVYSNDEDRWIVSRQSSKSNLYLKPVPPSAFVQGFLARVVSNISVSDRRLAKWVRVGNWNITERPGFFTTISGFSGNGAFVVFNPGVYIVTINLISRCTGIKECDLEMLVALNGRLSFSSGLYARQTVSSLGVDTLNIITVLHLFNWDSLTVVVRSDSSFEVLEESTFSVVMHASAGGPLLCPDNGPTLIRQLTPAYLRTKVGSSVTWSCGAVGEISPLYRWLKDYQVLPNATSNSLAIINGAVQDSGEYTCVAEISPLTVSSNIAHLIVYDPQPAFESLNYTVSVNENGPASQLILNISVRAESKHSTYAKVFLRIISGNVNNSFVLRPNSTSSYFGIYTTRPLDREDISTYQLHLESMNANEHAPQSVAAVNIAVSDLNDNAPIFGQKVYEVSLLENASIGHVLLQLHARDEDVGVNAHVTYTILAGSGAKTFSLNKLSGEVTLIELLDRETRPAYSLFVSAHDPDYPAFSEVLITVIDVNEYKPVFQPLRYHVSISEGTVIGTSILQLTATDKDAGTNSQLVYSIVAGDPHRLFCVDDDGILKVVKDLDHEMNSSHHLTVAVRDKGEMHLFAEKPAQVYISVRDMNDNSPIFEVSSYEETISESTPPGTAVLRVHAVDVDLSNSNGEIAFSMINEDQDFEFVVNSTSGIVFVRKSLDFETMQVYRFQLAVRDVSIADSRMDFTTIVIKVSDENDNFPVFDPSLYNVSISEATSVGRELLRVQATDEDSTSNGALNYFITAETENPIFLLDETSGILFLARNLDYENVSRYHLTISVTDQGTPPLIAKQPAVVTIAIYDENDNLPQFDSETYPVAVYENITSGTPILTVHANDRDSSFNQRITYTIASYSDPEARNRFEVNRNTGTLFTTRALDREEQEVYEFTVIARDGGKVPHEGFAKVIVTLIDVNDNNPVFEPTAYQSPIHISEDMSIASELITLTAADPDTRLRGKVTYTILDIAGASVSNDEEAFHCINESYGTFRINSYTGTLRVARKLAARCVYNVTVRAMDHGSPPLFSTISLLIETGNGNATALGIPTITAIVSQEDHKKIIIIICVFVLIIAIILTLVIWREGRRHIRKRRMMLARAVRNDNDSCFSDDNVRSRCKMYSMDHTATYLDHCSTTTEMPSSLQTPRSSEMDTDILETFTLPYDGKEGYTILNGDTESFCVSIDFGMESEEPFVFPVTMEAVNAIDRRVAKRKKSRARKHFRSTRSSTESKRSQVSLPAKFGSRKHSKGNGVREVISDTRL